MDYISQIEDECSYVGVYCVSSCQKIIDPSWLGYKFDSNCFPSNIVILGCVVYIIIAKGKKKHVF